MSRAEQRPEVYNQYKNCFERQLRKPFDIQELNFDFRNNRHVPFPIKVTVKVIPQLPHYWIRIVNKEYDRMLADVN